MWSIMCFSAEANLVAGLALLVIGIDTLRHVSHRRQILLAVLPFFFGVHQLTEVVVWWGLDGVVGSEALDTAVWLYLAFAFGVLPWLIGVAVAAIEPDSARRRLMFGIAGAGAVVSLLLVSASMTGSVGAEDGGFFVDYHTGISYGGQLAVAYVAVTCMPLQASSHRDLFVFGAMNLAVVGVLTWLVMAGVISLWCGWAAVTSAVIAHHLRHAGAPLPQRVRISHRPTPVH